VQRHNGAIDIESSPGKGSTFAIRLPTKTHEEPQARTERTEGPSASLHVLVLDDDPLILEVLTEYLTGDGHTIEVASNGKDGLEKFRAGRFDLVVTDRAMPDMSGDEVAAIIKEIALNKPIIMLTGFGEMMQAASEKPEAVDFIVSKPVTLSALRQAVAKAAAY